MRNVKTLIEEAKTFTDPGFVMGAPWVTTTYIGELVNALEELSQKLDERNAYCEGLEDAIEMCTEIIDNLKRSGS